MKIKQMPEKKTYKLKTRYSKARVQDDYIENLIDWEEHQYVAGYYTGGRLHPLYRNPGRPDMLGWIMVITSVLFGIMLILAVISGTGKDTSFNEIMWVAGFFIILIVEFLVGVRFIKKAKIKKNSNK
ncbi:MAG: hypothetical protein Q8920_10895 [Bacillota bacterium]|nr:hypothetical protein [Bacillota bacterium]